MRWVGSAVLLKIIELEKEMDLMRETLSILKDFSIEHLYLLLSAGDELVSRKQRALVNFGKHEFYGEYEEKDFAKILDKISDSQGFSLDQFRTLFYPIDPEYGELLNKVKEEEIS